MSETQFRNPCHTHRDIEILAGRKLDPDFNCGIKKKKKNNPNSHSVFVTNLK